MAVVPVHVVVREPVEYALTLDRSPHFVDKSTGGGSNTPVNLNGYRVAQHIIFQVAQGPLLAPQSSMALSTGTRVSPGFLQVLSPEAEYIDSSTIDDNSTRDISFFLQLNIL